MKAQVLERLSIQIEKIKRDAKSFDNAKWFDKNRYMRSKHRLFDPTLFNTRSMILLDYVDELSQTYINLPPLAHRRSYKYAIERLTAQLEAVIRVLKSTPVWQKDLDSNKFVKKKTYYKKAVKKIMQSSHDLHQELAKNKEFERRLLVMIEDKKALLHKARGDKASEINLDILTTHGRLGRCRKAISATEDKIKIAEKTK
ncbi:primosomal replication protein [Pseudoalteromonas sp. C2R02]|uniref:primosomal replication protein n=1 Tax=Pseudoalteromonas sp. C2R02 TaxID=2841565 RepID=UPI001C094061|nr:primosomal replication protein [Pseudoalteromonas sp. C2R02]MBU2970292.1 primosomal replication protein [Pseudoalteromonas sp. C2R02]